MSKIEKNYKHQCIVSNKFDSKHSIKVLGLEVQCQRAASKRSLKVSMAVKYNIEVGANVMCSISEVQWQSKVKHRNTHRRVELCFL